MHASQGRVHRHEISGWWLAIATHRPPLRGSGRLLHACHGMRRIHRLAGIAIEEDALDVVRTWGCVVMRYGAICNAFLGWAAVTETPEVCIVHRLLGE